MRDGVLHGKVRRGNVLPVALDPIGRRIARGRGHRDVGARVHAEQRGEGAVGRNVAALGVVRDGDRDGGARQNRLQGLQPLPQLLRAQTIDGIEPRRHTHRDRTFSNPLAVEPGTRTTRRRTGNGGKAKTITRSAAASRRKACKTAPTKPYCSVTLLQDSECSISICCHCHRSRFRHLPRADGEPDRKTIGNRDIGTEQRRHFERQHFLGLRQRQRASTRAVDVAAVARRRVGPAVAPLAGSS